ncbi:hypothetical protein K0M31_002846 [Melipona bicolor]|uniref:Uncharacterized protein n=1 Tax=Melipona bicolor TaxID=60889 RepID=A0AA40KQ03_9HYME|nr:hypothetical protein K0M31_002846 [Melipona bicolor]
MGNPGLIRDNNAIADSWLEVWPGNRAFCLISQSLETRITLGRPIDSSVNWRVVPGRPPGRSRRDPPVMSIAAKSREDCRGPSFRCGAREEREIAAKWLPSFRQSDNEAVITQRSPSDPRVRRTTLRYRSTFLSNYFPPKVESEESMEQEILSESKQTRDQYT